ncbi:MAG TPA: serine/threonine-protein kinase [Solirubrobacteraceae bacterium]|nr:serine/threonine-protein kinase [Solirubrobacteraceae bacterium]
MGADGWREGLEDTWAPRPAGLRGLAPGSVVGDCEILAVAGVGAMGIVYRARQRSLERTLALKLIRDHVARAPEYRERFLREARSAAAVDHPHVVSVYDAGEDRGRLYLAMQWVEGEDLSHMLARCGRLDPATAVQIGCQLASALDAIHGAGLIHRDVKPANVVVRDFDGREHAYLTDFGLARLAETSVEITRTGQVLGTAGYLAPEQLSGARPAPAGDLYALGCVIFQLLTGRPPFERDSELAVLMAHMNAPRPKPSAVVSGLDARYDAFMARALAVSPQERFGSGRELAETLERAASGAGWRPPATPAPEPGWPEPEPRSPAAEPGWPAPEPGWPAPEPRWPAPVPRPEPATSAFERPPASPSRHRSRLRHVLGLALLGAVVVLAVAALATSRLEDHGRPAASRSGSAAAPRAGSGTGTRGQTTGPGAASTSAASGPPTGAVTSCGGDLMSGPDTSCGFAANVERAYDRGPGGAIQISAYSPRTRRTYALQCTAAAPHVCTDTSGAAVYFSSGPASGMPGLRHCDPNIAADGATSCPLAENVFVAYYRSYEAGATQPTMGLTAYSPVTATIYRLECASTPATVSCAGPDGIFITFPLRSVKLY